MTALRHVVMPTRVLPHHSIGGMQAVAWDLATAFVRRGVDVTVITAEIPGSPPIFEDHGVQIHALHGISSRRYGRRWWQASRHAFEQSLMKGCDLVLSVSAAGLGLLPLRRRMPSVPFVLQAHGTSTGELISKWRSGSLRSMASSVRNAAWIVKDLSAYRHFDTIVTVGERVMADFGTWPIRNFVDLSCVKLIRNGIDTDLFRPDSDVRRRMRAELGWGDDLRIVVSASRLHRQKGIAHGLEGFALLAKSRQDLRYLIVGEGPELETLKAQAARLGIGAYVHFVGGVTHDHIPLYLNSADVLLFTTTHVEGQPLNVLEALAIGLPVVASRHLYRDGPPDERVLQASPTDAADVSEALRRALEFPSVRKNRLPPGCSAADCVEQYLKLFEELLGRG